MADVKGVQSLDSRVLTSATVPSFWEAAKGRTYSMETRPQEIGIRVAAVDDDPAQLELIASIMRSMGFGCHTFTGSGALLRALRNDTFDLIVMDWQMPEMKGPDLVMWIRENVSATVPVLFVTLRDDERDVVHGLSCGADDYMCKPIRVGELMARVRALLRRSAAATSAQDRLRQFGAVRFDVALRTLTLHGEAVDLRGREFDLALFFFSNIGRLVSRQHLVERLWGFGSSTSSRALDTLVSNLRTKMKLRPEFGYRLSAVYNVGYRFDLLSKEEPDLHKPAGKEG